MIPPKTDPRWKHILTGSLQHSFKVTSAAMCISRHQRHINHDPSPETLAKSLDDVHAFFTRFESILAEDLQSLFR